MSSVPSAAGMARSATSPSPASRPSPIDYLVAIIAGVLTAVLIHFDPEGSTRAPDALAYGLGIAAAAVLLVRRIRPMAVFGAVLVIHLVYHLLDYPGAGPFPVLMVAVFSIAAAGLRRGAIFGATFVALSAAVMQVLGEGAALTSPTVIMPAVFIAASVFAGEAAHNRSRYLAEVRERMARTEADRELETQRRLTEERLRIARELHDIIAHTITVITVQAGEAQDALDRHPEQTREALRNIREASREAMSELKATVGVLREPADSDGSRKPAPGLRDLPELVQMAGGGTLQTTLRLEGEARSLPAAVELTAYRIVQESLTNVIRHADATQAEVSVLYEPSTVTIQVEDNGNGPVGAASDGHGVSGMRERAEAIGGRLDVGPGAERGFRVRAVLPVDLRP